MFKKAQADMRELALTLVIVGVVAIVGVLIFSNVTNVTEQILDPDESTTVNESVTITSSGPATSDNSTLLSQLGYIDNSEVVRNDSGAFAKLTRNVDYRIRSVGTSASLTNRGNFTLINSTNSSTVLGFNATGLFVTYRTSVQSAAQATTESLESTVLDSFSLGVIALIVLAAVVILSVLFKLGTS